ncbi:uncharacterized protein LOC106478490 [Limulus polyphemus]|uniref:Uncharacterized protein LOC106478490 n=1 Tax=Limulus polyphemus TaxID=6850 RepID=A0ABM1C5E0_LIMPO|nr:uncharacterized protein LOC106478490 [Limulus polyphemus]XP_013794491.1 uncharacterized protein LOC106478490 [Limulus polyphemus]XP_013794492.1 uncharacterized protein LOC106478490 [Limulus polyphemus]XP_013794493.1 uncharacterized protein LOC106478490 [Limulus polyphemus]XP_022237805.1 uncharacterized protein LOC106478490 [Limulus polyphemus]XP_022237806.1 uncharacterized protein LOC106478490 [Limulus polyphemus]
MTSPPSESKLIPSRKYGISAWVGERFEKLAGKSNIEELGTSPRGEDFLNNLTRPQVIVTDAGMEGAQSKQKLISSASSPALLNLISLNVSRECSPNVSPSCSPKVMRKTLEDNSLQVTADSNHLGWATSGFFTHGRNTANFNAPLSSIKEAPDVPSPMTENKPYLGNKGETRMRKISAPAMSHRKCAFSNFDMNALSPTSW